MHMNNLNSILLEGNLTRDPELKHSSSGVSYCQFAIATNRYFKQQDEYQQEVSYFEVMTFSRLAETCAEYLRKGRGVRIVGRLKQSRWQSREGKNRSRVEIVAEHVEFKPKAKQQDRPELPGQRTDAQAAELQVPF